MNSIMYCAYGIGIVPILVAFQLEWNKMYYLLNADPTTMQLLETHEKRPEWRGKILKALWQGSQRTGSH